MKVSLKKAEEDTTGNSDVMDGEETEPETEATAGETTESDTGTEEAEGEIEEQPSSSKVFTPKGSETKILKRPRHLSPPAPAPADDSVGQALLQYVNSKQAKIQKSGHDEDELFLNSQVATLRRLAPQAKAIAKLKIQQLLFDLEFPPQHAKPAPPPPQPPMPPIQHNMWGSDVVKDPNGSTYIKL